MTHTPLLYMVIPLSRRHEIPLTLLPTMVGDRCAKCDQKVLAHRAMLRQAQAACRKQNVELQIVCKKCGDRNMREADEVIQFTPDIRNLKRHFRRH
jgi:hypothetical protein